jgi:hypothetical protein
MGKIAGLDVHSKWCVAVVQDEAGTVLEQENVETTVEGISGFVERHGLIGCKVGLESGAISFFVAKHLAIAGAAPVMGSTRRSLGWAGSQSPPFNCGKACAEANLRTRPNYS